MTDIHAFQLNVSRLADSQHAFLPVPSSRCICPCRQAISCMVSSKVKYQMDWPEIGQVLSPEKPTRLHFSHRVSNSLGGFGGKVGRVRVSYIRLRISETKAHDMVVMTSVLARKADWKEAPLLQAPTATWPPRKLDSKRSYKGQDCLISCCAFRKLPA